MKVLIDGIEAEIDNMCYQIKDGQRVAFHSSLHLTGSFPENSKVISGGHVYVVNYNSETYLKKTPETFSEYLSNK